MPKFFCPGQCGLHGGLVVILATYFTMLKIKEYLLDANSIEEHHYCILNHKRINKVIMLAYNRLIFYKYFVSVKLRMSPLNKKYCRVKSLFEHLSLTMRQMLGNLCFFLVK